jgi:hypothetical protein
MTLRAALDRTLLLMRDDIREEAPDGLLLDTLSGFRIALVADAANLESHSAQCTFVASSLLCARAGATIHLRAPNVVLRGPQPPLRLPRLLDALIEIDGKVIPKSSFVTVGDADSVDLALILGDSEGPHKAGLALSINASDWTGSISEIDCATRWAGNDWPLGGLTAAGLAAGEAFKAAMRKLRDWRRHDVFDDFFAPTHSAKVVLAPDSTPHPTHLGQVDFVSGGAITHSAIFVLARILAATGDGRVIEPDTNDISNTNRYSLLRMDRLRLEKAIDLASQDHADPTSLSKRHDATSESVHYRHHSGCVSNNTISTKALMAIGPSATAPSRPKIRIVSWSRFRDIEPPQIEHRLSNVTTSERAATHR